MLVRASFLLLCAVTFAASYTATIQLNSLKLTGLLSDGKTACSKLNAFGVSCYPLVAVCVERVDEKTKDPASCITSSWFDLGVTPNTLDVAWGQGVYGGWSNPQSFSIPGTLAICITEPFYIKLRVQHYYGTIISDIANAAFKIDDTTTSPIDVNEGQITSFKATFQVVA